MMGMREVKRLLKSAFIIMKFISIPLNYDFYYFYIWDPVLLFGL
jgi:hypothetical protein